MKVCGISLILLLQCSDGMLALERLMLTTLRGSI